MSAAHPLPQFAKEPRFWWWCYGAWFAILFLLSSFGSAPAGTPKIMVSDKLAHAVYFAAGSAALFWALTLGRRPVLSSKSLLPPFLCLIAAAMVGWFDEWHQSHTPGRSGNDLGDWLADLAGGVLGYLLGKLAHPYLRKPARVA